MVQGRFHAFDLARALLQRGHDVTLFTNYPKWAVERFNFPSGHVRSFWVHGVVSRATESLRSRNVLSGAEDKLHRLFGRWAADEIQKEKWDVVHPWSGVSEEIIKALAPRDELVVVMRGSAHIRTQARILEEEESRTGISQQRPSPWIISREQREYSLADRVVVLSSFAYGTFLEEKFPSERLWLLPLGSEVNAFRPSGAVMEARCRRILAGEPLRVLYVGALSFQKGLWDLEIIVRSLSDQKFRFRFIGPVSPEAKKFIAKISPPAEIVSKQSQEALPNSYSWGDVFMFPTLQDGFAQVLAQANASALPILATTNCSGPDFLTDGENGWVLPIRSPEAFARRLRWCDAHRGELAAMARRIYTQFQPRDWSAVATDFETMCLNHLKRSKGKGSVLWEARAT